MTRVRSHLSVLSVVAAVTVATILFLTASASAARIDPPRLERLFMRHTVAAASQPNWNLPLSNAAFTDSSCFRNTAGAVLSNNDTTVAIPIGNLPMEDAPNKILSVGDTLSQPWCVLFVRANDSVSGVTWAGTTTLDSVYVTAQWSHNGTVWADADGTPTKAFFAANVSPTTVIALAAVEQSNLAPIPINLACAASQMPTADQFIINKNLCMSGGFLRFIINTGAGTGQYTADLLHW